MNPQDQRIAGFVCVRFQKSGESISETGLLEDVSTEVQEFIQSAVALADGEIPLVVSLLSPTHWSVLTTRRLVVTSDNAAESIPWENFEDVIVDFSGLEYSLDAQSELSEAKVNTKDGGEIIVKTSPGQPFMGFWNCLNLAKQMGGEEARRRALADEQPNNS